MTLPAERRSARARAAHAQEEDPAGWWEETFKGHRDSKPKGPEAIAFDLAFPRVQHVYGLPQHATALALPPTTGAHPAAHAP